MRQKVVPMDVFVDGMDFDALRALNANKHDHKIVKQTDIDIINSAYRDYICGLCDNIFSINTRSSSAIIHSMHRISLRLSDLLYKCDSLALAQHHAVDTPDGICQEIIENWCRTESPYIDRDEKIRMGIAKINAELIRKRLGLNGELLGLGLALEQARDNYFGGTFGPLFIFNLRQLLAAFSDFLEIEISALEAHEREAGRTGAIKDTVTENFLLSLWELYKSISRNNEMDEGYYAMVEILAESADSEVKKNYGEHKSRLCRMDRESIRMAITRSGR